MYEMLHILQDCWFYVKNSISSDYVHQDKLKDLLKSAL